MNKKIISLMCSSLFVGLVICGESDFYFNTSQRVISYQVISHCYNSKKLQWSNKIRDAFRSDIKVICELLNFYDDEKRNEILVDVFCDLFSYAKGNWTSNESSWCEYCSKRMDSIENSLKNANFGKEYFCKHLKIVHSVVLVSNKLIQEKRFKKSLDASEILLVMKEHQVSKKNRNGVLSIILQVIEKMHSDDSDIVCN